MVVKAHGNSDAETYFNAIRLAKEMVEVDVINKVVAALPKEQTNE